MSGGPPGQPHHVDYYFHFPEEEYIKATGGHAFKLPEYYRKSMKEIESKLKSGDISKHEIEEFFHFLEHLSHEIREVLHEEKNEGISNLDLEKELRKVAALLNQLGNKEHD
jgi:hypothetical protein